MHDYYLQRYAYSRYGQQRPAHSKATQNQGHTVVEYHLVKDDPAQIQLWIARAMTNEAVHALIINGGTGVSRRDSTFEAVDAMLEKRLPGFGEIFRLLTYQEMGSSAIMSRAIAGIIKGRCVFSIPALNMLSKWRWKNSSFRNLAT